MLLFVGSALVLIFGLMVAVLVNGIMRVYQRSNKSSWPLGSLLLVLLDFAFDPHLNLGSLLFFVSGQIAGFIWLRDTKNSWDEKFYFTDLVVRSFVIAALAGVSHYINQSLRRYGL